MDTEKRVVETEDFRIQIEVRRKDSMLVMRPTYYLDVSAHRQDIATLLSELDTKNRRESAPRAVGHVISDSGERNDVDTIGAHCSSLVTYKKRIGASVNPKPSSVVGYVDL